MKKKLLYFALLNACVMSETLPSNAQQAQTTTAPKAAGKKFATPGKNKNARGQKDVAPIKIESSNIKNAQGIIDEILLNSRKEKIWINANLQGAAVGNGSLDANGTCTLYLGKANRKNAKVSKPTSPNAQPTPSKTEVVKVSIGSLTFSLDGKNLDSASLKKQIDQKTTDKIVATFTPASTPTTTPETPVAAQNTTQKAAAGQTAK